MRVRRFSPSLSFAHRSTSYGRFSIGASSSTPGMSKGSIRKHGCDHIGAIPPYIAPFEASLAAVSFQRRRWTCGRMEADAGSSPGFAHCRIPSRGIMRGVLGLMLTSEGAVLLASE
jgi:hypothetical protein